MEETSKNRRTQISRTPKSTGPSPFDQGKIPPQALELEEAVLGAMMLENQSLNEVIDLLKPEIFYKEAHQKIFSAIESLFHTGDPVDLLTVSNELKSKGFLELCGGPYYLTQLTNRVASTAHVEFHSRILMEKYILRSMIGASSNTIKKAYDDSSDAFELLDEAENDLFQISESNLRRSFSEVRVAIKSALDQIDKARQEEGNLSGIPSGFSALDRVTAGWQKTDLIVIAARPGMGKTAFVLSMARNIAVEHKKAVAVFSLEMGATQLATRLLASEAELPAESLRKGDLQEHEWTQLNAKIKNLSEAPLIIDDTPALSIFELRAKCRRLKQQHDIQLVVIDYLQLMTGPSDNKGNREQEISAISRSLKGLAKELDVPVIALSQLSRAVETRGGNKKPILSDLRESGAIEQDADIVLFIYRPEYYQIPQLEDGRSTEGLGQILIAKHRNGALAEIDLRFVSQFARFTDSEQDDYSQIGSESQAMSSMSIPSKMNDDAAPQVWDQNTGGGTPF